MASTSSSAGSGSFGCGDVEGLKKKRDKFGGERKFRRMCDSETVGLGFNVLHTAALSGQLETCKFLVEEVGVDIDVKTHRGETPLHIAMTSGHLNIAKYLIEQGADVTMTDSKGFTALHCSISYENPEIMTLLLSKGADIDADSIFGTPLHFAARYGRAGIVNFLLQNNAEPNSVTKYGGGTPPLVSAICSKTNTFECVELLLKANADPNKPSNGVSPLTYAVQTNANSCIDSLLAAGADVDSISSCGLRPIEQAALVGNVEAIWKLILARPRILASPNWSFSRLWSRMDSVPAKERILSHSQILREKGDGAWDKEDYSSAITSYTKAIPYSQSGKIFANRNLCWARKSEGLCALNDAEVCVLRYPNWVKAHLREATAWHLLERYHMSCDAFIRAYNLAPENEKIER